MMPGLRFLFVTTLLSTSVLVFAIGAAALLRATHDNFATFSSRRPPQEQIFVKQQFETSTPTIALLRVEPEAEPIAEKAPADVAVTLPDPPVPAIVDLDALRSEAMQTAPAATVETVAAAEPTVEMADAASEQTAGVTTSTADNGTKIAVEQRKKVDAERVRVRKLDAARRAREARLAAQRRRIAIARARAARQTQTQAPVLFNPAIGTN